MKVSPIAGTLVLPCLLLLLISSCQKETQTETENDAVTTAKLDGQSDGALSKLLKTDLLKAVHSATARFHSTTQAIKHNYTPDEHCVSVPGLGGMGYHWVNWDLVDATFDPLKPEALLYAKKPNGKLELIGLEYIVMNEGQERPVFDTRPFDTRGVPVISEDHWSLHVWLYEPNPAGMFTPFNPNVRCN